MVEDDHNMYLFIDNAQAFVLPKGMFDSSESLAQLRTWVSS
ncbi:MAG: YcxB family protein [Rhodocyclaceae bacterium]|nr:YcxB family protein [Rhodocyclaceae bacterium]MCA3083224.1 YcxB family protein [Rhodocyclaceae bacterium]